MQHKRINNEYPHNHNTCDSSAQHGDDAWNISEDVNNKIFNTEDSLPGISIASISLSGNDTGEEIGGTKLRKQKSASVEEFAGFSGNFLENLGKMAHSINHLNRMLCSERNKADSLLNEIFSLKTKNQELQNLVDNLLNS